LLPTKKSRKANQNLQQIKKPNHHKLNKKDHHQQIKEIQKIKKIRIKNNLNSLKRRDLQVEKVGMTLKWSQMIPLK